MRNVKLLYIINFFTDFVLFAPVAIIYFEKVTGSYALGMSIFSVAYFSSALFEIPTGVVSDMVGRKVTVILGALNSFICLLLYAIAGNYSVLFIGAIFQGLSRSFYSGNNNALLYDSLKEENKEDRYHFYLGKTSSMFQAALAIASLLGGFMAAISLSLVMWVSVIPQIFTLLASFLLKEPKKTYDKNEANIYSHLGEALSEFRKNLKLRLLTGSSVIGFSLGESAFFLRSAFVNTLWPLWAVGISYTLSHIGGALSYWFSGKIIDKYKPLKILNFAVIYGRIVNFIALFFPNVISPALMSSTSLTFGITGVAENSLLQKEFTDKQRATMGSMNSFAGNIAFGVSSLLLGVIADNLGVVKALILIQILLLLQIVFYRKLKTLL